MEQIVLNKNLRYVIAGLNLEQRGLLLNALLSGEEDALEEGVSNIYKYIMLLQQELADKRQKMRELGAKGGSARRRATENLTADLFDADVASLSETEAAVKQANNKRKEAKEKNILNKKIKNLFIGLEKEKKEEERNFVPPLVDEVKAFVTAEGLDVDAETFVDFYDSHGWKVGQTAIKNWQATARLWHRRSGGAKPPPGKKALGEVTKSEEEAYWHELAERQKPVDELLCSCMRASGAKSNGTTVKMGTDELGNKTDDVCGSPFVRFIRRLEDK